jgi:hypothetical protein
MTFVFVEPIWLGLRITCESGNTGEWPVGHSSVPGHSSVMKGGSVHRAGPIEPEGTYYGELWTEEHAAVDGWAMADRQRSRRTNRRCPIVEFDRDEEEMKRNGSHWGH